MRRIFDKEKNVSISAETIVFAVFFILGLYFLYFVREIVVTVFLSVILMSALHPGVRWLVKKARFPRVLAILCFYLLLICVFSFFLFVIIPPLASEVPNLVQSLHLPDIPIHLPTAQLTLSQIGDFLNQFGSSFGAIFDVVSSTFNGILAFFTVLVMTFYLLLDREHLHEKIVWFSNDQRHVQLVKRYIDDIEVQLGGWVRGQLLLMVTIGVLCFIALTLLGVPFALPLALASALLEILPNLGPTLAAIPAVVVAYTSGGPTVFGLVLLSYIIIQQLENHLIVPRIMKANVDVSPLVTIVTILTGLKVAGMIGALLAVPFYILLRGLYSLYRQEKALHAE